jgi:hypothetical protein
MNNFTFALRSSGNKESSCELDSSGSGSGTVAGPYERSNKPLSSMTGRKFLDHLSDCQLSKDGGSEYFPSM